MTTVYIWGTNPTNHASVKVGNRYFSFHPANKNLPKELSTGVKGIVKRSYWDDAELYGTPVYSETLLELNEEAMLDMIGILDSNDPKYHLLLTNCSTSVIKILRAGFGYRHYAEELFSDAYLKTKTLLSRLPEKSDFFNKIPPKSIVETISDTVERIALKSRNLRLNKTSTVAFATLVATDAIQQAMTSTPWDVYTFTKFIKEHEGHLDG